jgi:response regulator of citrate/malate metabolism
MQNNSDPERKMKKLTSFLRTRLTLRAAFEDAQEKLEVYTECFEKLLASREFTQEEMDRATNLMTDAQDEMRKAEQTWKSSREFTDWKLFGQQEEA